MLGRLHFRDHVEIMIIRISSFEHSFQNAQTTLMHKNHNYCFHDRTFVNFHQKEQSIKGMVSITFHLAEALINA